MRGWSDQREEQLERLAERPPGQASLAPFSNGMSDKGGGLSILEWDGPALWSSASTARGTPSFNMTTRVRRSIRDLGGGVPDGEQQAARGLDSHMAQIVNNRIPMTGMPRRPLVPSSQLPAIMASPFVVPAEAIRVGWEDTVIMVAFSSYLASLLRVEDALRTVPGC